MGLTPVGLCRKESSMHDINSAQTGADGLGNAGNNTGDPPPIWHQMEAASVMFRSLLHEPGEAQEHNHDTMELILNFGTAPGVVDWRDADGGERTTVLHPDDCCLIPAGVSHLVNGLRARGAVSLLVGGVLIGDSTSRNLTDVSVENLRQLAARDRVIDGLVPEFGNVIVREPHVLLVNALGFAVALKLVHTMLYRDNNYDEDHVRLCPSEQRRAMDYLREHGSERVQVGDLARCLGVSRAHFARRFRATFGMPPLQYALKMRVDRALEMLRAGGCRVAEAAYAVGFYDQSHLDRHCRKIYGKPPSALMGI